MERFCNFEGYLFIHLNPFSKMLYEGVLRIMLTEFADPIEYYLNLDNAYINVNQLLDKTISISFLRYECLNCALQKKIFRQGFCYDCFMSLPQTADWIINPELSKAHLGIEERDLEYEKMVQLQPHVVYLANSSSVKVGVTRKSQIPTRWIDQGAHEAIKVVETPNRYLAGISEVVLKNHVSDKTNWRNMLTNNITDEDLKEWKENLKQYLPEEVQPYFIDTSEEVNFNFPVLQFPKNPKSLNLDKTPFYQGILKGIKGQYLIFEDDTVLNIRSNEGRVIGLEIN